MITRREFIGVCSALGLTPDSAIQACSSRDVDGSVIVIGAGAAGMSLGHLLAQRGGDFRILEAAPSYGGRIKTKHDFVEFPIPLGGEWLHASANTLSRIVNDDSIEVTTRLASYQRKATFGSYKNGKLSIEPIGRYRDLKFVNGTWLTFYEKYILPGIVKHMQFQTQVVRIDYSSDRVLLTDARGKEYAGDRVVVTVPPQIIRDRSIKFMPPLPKRKQKAFDDAYIWGGMKVFIEFKRRFYPTFLEIDGTNDDSGQKAFYDAAYGQETAANVLGLFVVGAQAKPYQARVGNRLRDYVLAELDRIFDGAASSNYVRHITQNWSEEKFIRQAYFADSGNWRLPPRMQETVAGRILFAGDTYTDGEDWGSVHAAAQSARDAFEQIVR